MQGCPSDWTQLPQQPGQECLRLDEQWAVGTPFQVPSQMGPPDQAVWARVDTAQAAQGNMQQRSGTLEHMQS